ncbi:hypothetical protein D9V30_10365 [Mycetocola reblochoni]|uniref:YqaJ viral recombinase domain-containing protein n=2 Tax=Mycetocola reblochoni TaxID=331618 RepID=A0A1R4JQ52_9MICO|nr:YqaJ viral recombinase family protein [Mycetocola reblochoni]RLP68384.1 hypothetical protein D9V30_10365 [Mycetocola reblochoni]SJN33923.1 hypothetical protein FM119_08650 [Mycetocola reblochoni REB411]
MSYTLLDRSNEAEWHAQRRTGITATDIARLSGGGPATWAAVKAEKLGAGSTFRGNRYTEWGKEREPVIAGFVEFAYDVHPNDRVAVFDGAEPWLATPDGLGAGRNGEYKTTTKDWAVALPAIPRNYVAQVDWAQLVTAATETVFAWEPHENFIPGEIRTLLIPRAEDRINALIETALQFQDYLARDDDAPSEWDDLLGRYSAAQAAADEAQAALDEVKAAIRDRAGDREVAVKSPFGSISYATPKPRQTFDQAAFRKDHPEIAAEYMKTTEAAQPTLRVTVKGA